MEYTTEDVDQQVVLEEEIDENYEPTEKEILEYASWLGIDLETEQELLFIARDGLKAPLPEDWKPCQTPSGEIYYFNFATGESIWDHPCDHRFRELYQKRKSELLQRRQLEAEGQQEQSQQPEEQQTTAVQNAEEADPQQHMQQGTTKLQVSVSQLPVISHTEIEPLQLPLSSPTGTLSTLPSAATTSMIESPVSGLAKDATQAVLQEPSSKGLSTSRSASATGAVTAAAAAAAQSGGTTEWQATIDAADHEQRKAYRQHLDEDRRLWEQGLRGEVEQQQVALQHLHKQRLWSLQQQLDEQESQVVQQLKVEKEARLQALRGQLQLQQDAELRSSSQQHADSMAQLKAQQTSAEASAAAMLQAAQERLSSSAALSEGELSAVKQKTAAAAKEQAIADAAGRKQQLLKEAMQQIDQEVAGQVTDYRASRRAAALRELAGQLDADMDAAAEKLEAQTVELQRLETAVADKAAVLQKLTDQAQGKPLQASSSAEAAALGTASAHQQLANLQQQVRQAQQQLESTDAAVAARRAAAAEAEQQLTLLKQDISVCEPKLASIKQQLQQLEGDIKARAAEQQQRQADLQVTNRRLAGLREEVARRQSQLESLNSLYIERQASLRDMAAELAKRLGELSTVESGLSDTLRKKADAEFLSLEEQLRRTRKAIADSTAELASKQAALSSTSSQLSTVQAALDGAEASLSAKRKELQDVLGQLQAAAVQEFQDAKKILLDEEARLLESERRAMQGRVVEQMESERRAALAAGRRRIEREVTDQLASEQALMLAQRQEQVKKWLNADGDVNHVIRCIQAANSHPQVPSMNISNSPAPGGRSSFGVAAMLARDVDSKDRTGGSAVASVKSLPAGCISESVGIGARDPAAAACRQRSKSLSPTGKICLPSRRSTSQEVLLISSRQQQQWKQQPDRPSMDRRRSGAEASTSTGIAAAAAESIAESADAMATAVRGRLEALAAGTAATEFVQQLQDLPSPQPRPYSALLLHAKQFIKHRRREIQQRQASVLAAQAEWKAALAATEQLAPDGTEDEEVAQRLRQLKIVLQEQIHGLNEETRQLKALKAQVQQLEAYVALLQQQGSDMKQEQSCSAPGFIDLHVCRLLQQSRNSASCVLPPSPPTLYKQELMHQQPHAHVSHPADAAASMLQKESSLDRVAAALQHALSAATSSARRMASSGRVNADSSRGSNWQSHGRKRSQTFSPGPDLLQPGAVMPETSFSQQGNSSPGLVCINKLREERNVAQNVMQQHSQWLQDFRQQLSTVAHVNQQQAAGSSFQVQHIRAPPVQAECSRRQSSGDLLSPIATSTLLTPRSGQPVTVDLGGQQLVISLLPKSA